MKILLVDDSKRFLSGLKNMLESHHYEVVGVATSAAEAIRQTEALAPHLVLMDIQMPGESGIDATRALKRAHPLLKIVMMTVSDSDEHLFEAIAAGADGYLIKGERPELFVDALACLARGETPLSPGLAMKIMTEFARRSRASEPPTQTGIAPTGKTKTGEILPGDEEKLTGRQHTILSLIAKGRSYQEIARQVGISVAGVNYHVAEITARLHVENRAQAIACYRAQK
jgi:two-component system NarL family response regulator